VGGRREEATQMNGRAGPLRVLAESDYRYGVGRLILRIERIDWASPVRYEQENWYHVDGVEVDRRGIERGRRRVLVRGAKLPPPPTGRVPT
jgi:hypothetical protein